jgi:nicotinate-nucleotide pyrophosphorylase (carboxylating)
MTLPAALTDTVQPDQIPELRDAVRRALVEDDATHDLTSALLGPVTRWPATARLVVEEPCVLAGAQVPAAVFAELDPDCAVDLHSQDGDAIAAGATIATVRGPLGALLGGERVALNFLQRLSGIATVTRRVVEAVAGTGAHVTHTRKTTPGLRALERMAVRAGGGVDHRSSLGDAVLWKDNHWVALAAAGGTLRKALAEVPPDRLVIVEVESEAQFTEALATGVTRILVDNQTPAQVAEWARRAGPAVAIEASGGITPETAAEFARAGARFLSLGSLTHSVRAIAIRLDLEPLVSP